MSCEFAGSRVHAYLDGELSAAESGQFEQHLVTCADCAAALAAEKTLRESLQRAALYEHATPRLRQRVREALPSPPKATTKRFAGWRWLALAGAAASVVILGLALRQWELAKVEDAQVAAAVDAHLRSLQPGHLADVPSSDQHTVKPWFEGKLDFAPPVRDFAADGFPLTGGRLDVVGGRTVAALVYGRRKHVVNVFIWPMADAKALTGSGEHRGYRWAAWKEDGFVFVAVSDTAAEDLTELQQLFMRK